MKQSKLSWKVKQDWLWKLMSSVFILCAATLTCSAATYYVATTGSDAEAGTNWSTALLTISNGVAKADSDGGGGVIVSNGTYVLSATLKITNAITLTSLEGAANTIVDGNEAVRCFFISHADAVVDGFTITKGYVALGLPPDDEGAGVFIATNGLLCNSIIISNQAYRSGGGVQLYYGGVVSNCTISHNIADKYWGGGARLYYGGLLQRCIVNNNIGGATATDQRYGGGVVVNRDPGIVENCLIIGNTAHMGGGVYMENGGKMRNCTVTGNTAVREGGAGGVGYIGTQHNIANSIIHFNSAPPGTTENYAGNNARFSCITPLPEGDGNIAGDPEFVNRQEGDFRLAAGSPCVDAGTNEPWMSGAIDLAGNNRILNGTVDIGSYELDPNVFACNPIADFPRGFAAHTVIFTASVAGSDTNNLYYRWSFTNEAFIDQEGFSRRVVTNVYESGLHTVALSVTNGSGDITSLVKTNYIIAGPATNYVSASGSHQYPYLSWATAANDIQSAVDAGIDGTVTLAEEGVHNLNGTLIITNGITLGSRSGASSATLAGNGAERCLYLGHTGAVVTGFTISNGAAAGSGDELHGGGAYFYYSGTIRDCLITDNSAIGNGGGAYLFRGGIVMNSIIRNNTPGWGGGGSYLYYGGTVQNSLIVCNIAGRHGGGLHTYGSGTVRNCTITSNTVTGATYKGGGIYSDRGGYIENSIIYYNTAPSNQNWTYNSTAPVYLHCCTAPTNDLPGDGIGHIESDPMFKNASAGYYRLQKDSPCINAGTNAAWITPETTDVQGNSRIFQRIVDIGAYEWTSRGTRFIFR